ncbi:hypothetical protein ABW20_dc0101738 [Dactylellina cionopaga]|nr:hypothetical protein ABW20_dc0101738 [Dactylellina cionopaga]
MPFKTVNMLPFNSDSPLNAEHEQRSTPDSHSLATINIENSPTRTSKSAKPRDQGIVPAHYFYVEAGLTIRCNSPSFVANLIPHESFPGIDEGDFPPWRNERAWSLEEAFEVIREKQLSCEDCRCGPAGNIIAAPQGAVGRGGGRGQCARQHMADICAVVYVKGAIMIDYQRALDKISQTVKNSNKNFQWDYWIGERTPDIAPQKLALSKNRVQVHDPDFREPYYIEGPSDGPTWNWFGALGAGLGGLSKIAKRGVVEILD